MFYKMTEKAEQVDGDIEGQRKGVLHHARVPPSCPLEDFIERLHSFLTSDTSLHNGDCSREQEQLGK